MISSRRGSLFVFAALLAFGGARDARSQEVFGPPATTNWVPRNRTTLNTGNTTIVAGNQTARFYNGGTLNAAPNNDLIKLRSGGTANNPIHLPGFDNHGEFNITSLADQTFTLNTRSVVAVPLYMQGSINVSALGGATNKGGAIGSVVIQDAANNTVLSVQDFPTANSTTGSGGSNDVFKYGRVTLDPGTYTVRAALITKAAADGGVLGSSVDVNYYSGNAAAYAASPNSRAGLATVVTAYAANLGNSRFNVNVSSGVRTNFGVDGTGVRVGLLEYFRPNMAGDPNGGHDSLAGRLEVLNTGAANAATGITGTAGAVANRGEHSLATSSIIAAADASDGNAGIAPGATIVSAAISTYGNANGKSRFENALIDLRANNVRVINMSAAGGTTALVNTFINNNPGITFVKSAGNGGAAGTVSSPGLAENVITVGGLNRDFTQRASYSSFSANSMPSKPDIVAPSEQINVAMSRDLNGNGRNDDFSRAFLGDTFDTNHITTGEVSGTSFAAPHVSGAVALLEEYQTNNAAGHVDDHRVMKAVLLNSADTNNGAGNPLLHGDGATAWTQVTAGAVATKNLAVTRSLDNELGAGELDVVNALRQYRPDEVKAGSANTDQHSMINVAGKALWWDLENVNKFIGPAGAGTVDYLLGAVSGASIRATFTWDNVAGRLPHLEFRLYEEGRNMGNKDGFDIANPNADDLIAQTDGVGENVKLFDLMIPFFAGALVPDRFYLEVINLDATDNAVYGIAARVRAVPEPAAFALVLVGGLAWRSGRRRASKRLAEAA